MIEVISQPEEALVISSAANPHSFDTRLLAIVSPHIVVQVRLMKQKLPNP